MIVDNQEQLTDAVLAEVLRTEDPRMREVLAATVRHLHALAREMRLSETEFHEACAFIAGLGQKTNEKHNEVVLCAGSLGISMLICLLNNGNQGQSETTANLLGPFWRTDSPETSNGDSIVRSTTPGLPLFVNAWVKDPAGDPVADAEIDVWHSSPEGFYENQDPEQANMNLRGKFRTNPDGHIAFRTVKPAGYPIPIDGPVGQLLRVQGRHNMRPAHLHFLIHKNGFKTQTSQVYVKDDPYIDTDAQFGVTKALLGDYVLHENVTAPVEGVDGAWYSLDFNFVVELGERKLPRAPIKSKSQDARPALERLHRR
jgi:hydroxyquinol 1,2-dioxygenase